MFLIVGLGNPEPEYSRTRHNMGFSVVNKLAEKYNIEIDKTGFEAEYGIGNIKNKKIILFKPQTFMNLSGEAIYQIVRFYKIPIKDMLIIYDDIDIDVGKIRIKKNGSSGGHNGIKSIIDNLNTDDFKRIRIGIGKPKPGEDLIEHVIRKVTNEEYKKLQIGVEKGVQAVGDILENGIEKAMNDFN